MIFVPSTRCGNFFNLLLETSSDFCLNLPTRSHRENIQRHRLSDNSCLHAGLYVFRPSSPRTLDSTVNRRNLFYLLLVSWWIVFGRSSSFGNRSSFTRL